MALAIAEVHQLLQYNSVQRQLNETLHNFPLHMIDKTAPDAQAHELACQHTRAPKGQQR